MTDARKKLPAPKTSARGLILSRAILAGAVGLVPVPWIDDLLAGAVRAALLRKLGELRRVDLDANAIDFLTTPRGSRVLHAATFGAAALGATRRAFRHIATSLIVVRRADEAVQTFQVGTLFEHYAAHHHTGFGLDGKRAEAVRRAMDRAVSQARSSAVEQTFRRALAASGRAALAVPRNLIGRLRKKKSPDGADAVAGEPIEERLERAAGSNPIARAVARLDAELDKNYVHALTAAFDAAWAEEKLAAAT